MLIYLNFYKYIRHFFTDLYAYIALLSPQIKFLNPMISRKPKLQRQKKLFRHNKVPRPNQMNINVAAWGRLIKNIQPGSQVRL